jgi:hypothetical protein
MKKRYDEGGEIDAMEEANNRSTFTPRKVSIGSGDAPRKRPVPSANDESGTLQNLISSGSDIVGRPQDEGYRPNAGTARERAMAEGAYDSGKITESGDQGFGGPGSSRTVKATPKAAPKATPKAEARDTGSDVARMANRAKPAATPVDVTKLSVAERRKMSRDNPSVGGPTDKRSVGERLRSAFAGKNRGGNSVDFGGTGLGMKSGGSVSSASRRADGIATKGKTRGKMC